MSADEPEEQIRLLTIERPQADLVDDEQRAVQAAPGFEAVGRDGGIACENVREIVEQEVGCDASWL